MSKDRRYKTTRDFIQKGHIKMMPEIFGYEFIPKSIVARDLRTNNTRFSNLIKNPMKFRLEELQKMADLFEVDISILINIALGKRKRGKR